MLVNHAIDDLSQPGGLGPHWQFAQSHEIHVPSREPVEQRIVPCGRQRRQQVLEGRMLSLIAPCNRSSLRRFLK